MKPLDILYTILFFLKGNRDFFKLLSDFQDKLPPQQKRAQKTFTPLLPYVTVIDTTQMKMNLTTADIDLFQKKLENFNYNLIFFKRKKIESYSKNLQRLICNAGWEKFGIALVQNLLEDEAFKSNKPYLFGYNIGKRLGY